MTNSPVVQVLVHGGGLGEGDGGRGHARGAVHVVVQPAQSVLPELQVVQPVAGPQVVHLQYRHHVYNDILTLYISNGQKYVSM